MMTTLLELLVSRLPQFRKARLPSLYSDFRQQQYSNSDGYEANIAAWEAALAFAAENQAIPESSNSLSITTGNELLEALESRDYGTPAALGTVISEAVKKGHLVPKSIFLQAKPGLVENNSSSISSRLITWAMHQLGVSSWVPDHIPVGEFVVMTNLKKASEKLLPLTSEQRGRIDSIWPVEEFRSAVSKQLVLHGSITEDDLQILLMYLSRDRKTLAYGGDLIKFRGTSSDVVRITEQDRNIASLKVLILDLSTQTRTISSKIESLDKVARDALAAKNRNVALRSLRAKKVQESLLSQRSDTLFRLEGVLTDIENAANQVEVMSVLRSSTTVLKSLNAEIGEMDSLQDVLDTINEEMMKTQEISNTIGEANQAGLVIDEAEVDDELAALEAQEQDKKNEEEAKILQEKLDQLPTVPIDVAVPASTAQESERAQLEKA